MALEAQTVALRPQQLFVVAAVSFMAGRATLSKHRLMMYLLLLQVSDIAMAAKADLHRISLGQTRLAAGMWTVAVGAIAGRARMLHLGRLDLLCLLVMAGDAQRLHVLLRQHDFAVLRRRM